MHPKVLCQMPLQGDPLCPACRKKEETSFHFLENAVLICGLDIPFLEFTSCNLRSCIRWNHLLFCSSQEPREVIVTFGCTGDTHWADGIKGLSAEWLTPARPKDKGTGKGPSCSQPPHIRLGDWLILCLVA